MQLMYKKTGKIQELTSNACVNGSIRYGEKLIIYSNYYLLKKEKDSFTVGFAVLQDVLCGQSILTCYNLVDL